MMDAEIKHADDDELITAKWLKSIGFLDDGSGCMRHIVKSTEYCEFGLVQHGWWIMEARRKRLYWHDGVAFGNFRTRGDVRRLCMVLDVACK